MCNARNYQTVTKRNAKRSGHFLNGHGQSNDSGTEFVRDVKILGTIKENKTDGRRKHTERERERKKEYKAHQSVIT
jgi:hypothetical protein